jgi:hypothetical protein
MKIETNPDFEQSRIDELTRNERTAVENYILMRIRRSSRIHSTYSLKQKLTMETGIYIFQKDMYLLMQSLGYKVFIDYKGYHYAYAEYRSARSINKQKQDISHAV